MGREFEKYSEAGSESHAGGDDKLTIFFKSPNQSIDI